MKHKRLFGLGLPPPPPDPHHKDAASGPRSEAALLTVGDWRHGYQSYVRKSLDLWCLLEAADLDG